MCKYVCSLDDIFAFDFSHQLVSEQILSREFLTKWMMSPQWFSLPSKVSMLLWHVEPECRMKVMVVEKVCDLLLVTVFISSIFLLQAICETVGGCFGRRVWRC